MPANSNPQALTTTEALLGRALTENHLLREQLQRQQAEIEKIRQELIALRGGSSGADEGDTPAPEA